MRLSWRGVVTGRDGGLGARASATDDPILGLLRAGVAVRKEEPRFACDQQLVHITQRRQRDLRSADFHRGANDRIELPGGHLRDDTGLKLDVREFAGGAMLDHHAARDLTVQRMPAVMDHDVLPDMGRMTARLP